MDRSGKVESAQRGGVLIRPWMTAAGGAVLVVHGLLLYGVAWASLERARCGQWIIAIPTAQVVLVTWWAVFSMAPRAISVPAVLITIVISAFALVSSRYGQNAVAAESAGLSLWFASNALVVALIFAFVRVDFAQQEEQDRIEVARFQFGIAHMLLWTAALAITLSLIGVCMEVFHWSWAALAANSLLLIGLMALANSLTAVVVYVSFCSHFIFALSASTCGTLLCIACYEKQNQMFLEEGATDVLLMATIETTLLYVTLLPLKAAGWPIFMARREQRTPEDAT